VKVAQELARHSTPTLTLGRYSHVQLVDQKQALDALPSTDAPKPECEAARATGTCDVAAPTPPTPQQARSAFAARRRPGTPTPAMTRQDKGSEGRDDEGVVSGAGVATCEHLSTHDNGATSGIRTPNPRFTKAVPRIRKSREAKEIRKAEERLAAHLQRAEDRPQNTLEMPPDLAEVAAAWPCLADHIKKAIHTLVRTAWAR